MGWFEKYSQTMGGAGQEGAAETGTGDSGGGFAYAPKDDDGTSPSFDGKAVNKIIADKILSPLYAIPKEAMGYLETSVDSSVDKFVVELALSGRLRGFTDVVESYVNDGVWMAVETGSKEGLDAFQKWYSDMVSYTNDRDVFKLSEIQQSGLTGVV